MLLLKIFISFLKTSCFAIGGAYSFLPLLQKEIVEKHGWLTKEEFLDLLGMVKIFPGAISIKYASYTGYKLSGIIGLIVANLGIMLPPIFFIVVANHFYKKIQNTPSLKTAFETIQLSMFALIIAVAFQLVTISQVKSIRNILIIVISFSLFTFFKVHPIIIIMLSGVIGFFLK